jgi:D-alanyl-D-alanine carboxypeptidase
MPSPKVPCNDAPRRPHTDSRSWALIHCVTLLAGSVVAVTTTSMLLAATSAADPADDLGGALRSVAATDGFTGAIGVIRDGTSTQTRSAGYADVPTRAGFVANTHVRVASITKTFVAATILQMAAEGLIDLDAPVETYLPGRLRGIGIDGESITVREILQHRSGLPEYFANPGDLDLTESTPDDVLDMALRRPAQFPAGTAVKYTNTNYVVAGLLIAAVAGRPATDEVTRRILIPLGLIHTYFPDPGERGLRPPFAHGYELLHGQIVDATEDKGTAVAMDGSLISTDEDTTAFLVALLDGRVVPRPQLLAMMDTVIPGSGPAEEYGLGLIRRTLDCGVTVWGHSGDGPGYRSVMAEQLGGPAVTVTFTQSAAPSESPDSDPRMTVLEAVFCPRNRNAKADHTFQAWPASNTSAENNQPPI